MQTRSKTSMARQVVFSKQAETKASIENVPINPNKQIKQSNRSSKQTDQANKQINHTNKNAKGSIYLALGKPSRQVEVKRTSGKRKRASNTGPIKSNQENEAIKQIKQTNKIDKRQRFLLFRTTMCSVWFFRLKGMPLQLLPKIAKMSRLVLSAKLRPGIRPGPADGPEPSGGRQTATPSETY